MWVFLGVAVVAAIWAIGVFNNMATLRVRSKSAWADIDAQLKRRYDLIPNLVETVKGYASHEKGALESVVRLRGQTMTATSPAARGEAEAGLAQALKSVFALAEAYPDLKANQNFLGLQKSLEDIENDLQNARRFYNAVVRDYNTSLEVFPGRLVAGPFGFSAAEFFQAGEGEKAVPKVSFS